MMGAPFALKRFVKKRRTIIAATRSSRIVYSTNRDTSYLT